MTNKFFLTLVLAASQLLAFGQDAPAKKVNFYLGTLPSVSNKFDQDVLVSNLYLRNNEYAKIQYEIDLGLQEHFNHLVVPVLFIADLKNSLAFIVDTRLSMFNYEANRNFINPFFADKNGYRRENVSGFGIYQYNGVGKAFRFLENKNLMVLPHVGIHSGVISSDYVSSSKINGNESRNHYTNANFYLGAQTGLIINFDLSKHFALGLNFNNVFGIQYNEVSREEISENNTYFGLSSKFSNSNFYLALKF